MQYDIYLENQRQHPEPSGATCLRCQSTKFVSTELVDKHFAGRSKLESFYLRLVSMLIDKVDRAPIRIEIALCRNCWIGVRRSVRISELGPLITLVMIGLGVLTYFVSGGLLFWMFIATSLILRLVEPIYEWWAFPGFQTITETKAIVSTSKEGLRELRIAGIQSFERNRLNPRSICFRCESRNNVVHLSYSEKWISRYFLPLYAFGILPYYLAKFLIGTSHDLEIPMCESCKISFCRVSRTVKIFRISSFVSILIAFLAIHYSQIWVVPLLGAIGTCFVWTLAWMYMSDKKPVIKRLQKDSVEVWARGLGRVTFVKRQES